VYAGGIFDLDGKPKNKGQKHKQDGSKGEEVAQPGLLRWRRADGFEKDKEIGSRASAFKQGVLYEDAMASVSRAFVGMVYSLHGMKAARQFVRANWFSRRAQVGDLLKFTNPFLVLKYTLAKYNREPPVARCAHFIYLTYLESVFFISFTDGSSLA
jgi:large subunit ribosomal protein L44